MQVADFLQADMSAVSACICEAFKRGEPASPPTWKRLKAESAHLRDAILRYHPLLASIDGQGIEPLAVALAELPRALGLRAVRSRCTPSPDRPALAINIRSPIVTKELPALLPALTELRRVSISADIDDPNADQDDSTHAPATQAAHGWVPLITTALRSHPQLASVHIHLPPPPAHASHAPAKYANEGHAAVLGALRALTAVTDLRLRCREVQAKALGETLRAALPQLEGARRNAARRAPSAHQFAPAGAVRRRAGCVLLYHRTAGSVCARGRHADVASRRRRCGYGCRRAAWLDAPPLGRVVH